MKLKALSVLICFAFHATSAGAQGQKTHGLQSAAIGHMSGGTINNINYQVTPPPAPNLSSLDKKREALLMAENPTVLEVSDVRWTQWWGDRESYLTVMLLNKSKLPALDVRLELLDDKTGTTIASLRPHKLAQSYALKILADQRISVPGGGAWAWPLASVTSVEQIVGKDCITGSGLDFDTGTTSLASSPNAPLGVFSSNQSAMYVRVAYKTIFDEKINYSKTVVIDSAPRSQTHVRERGSGRIVPLKCVDESAEVKIG
ncbi:hypothetical protein [Massilia sp. ZL223]|uniref:hypothetical protein n=1 Tax=Massilia sp. ZL223 TaxID=2824904 RepID=UPI001B83E2E2|nr:hypothetical protein [Massilia sp. ZL223]MBQ5962673.1 hypothetical protein [Massilia sp. ZL223]